MLAPIYNLTLIHDKHRVQLVLSKSHSKADVTCSKLLVKLDKYKNPFLYISKTDPKNIYGTTGIAVDVFYTHDVRLGRGNYGNTFLHKG